MNELENIDRRGLELKSSCPFKHMHAGGADNNPSFTVNVATGVYYCNSCHSKGNVHTYIKEKYSMASKEAWLHLGDSIGLERPSSEIVRPEINTGLIHEYHQRLMESTGPIRDMLATKRGLVVDTLKRFQLGYDGDRITIPVYDEYNTLVNIRKYKWNSTDNKYKVINHEDADGNKYGEVRIFNLESLLYNKSVLWCEGELDAIIAEQYGIKAACPTSGAGTLKPEWIKLFKGKTIYLGLDNDEAGKMGTIKLCEALSKVCKLKIINWPSDFPEKGDVTDFFTTYKGTKEGFVDLLKNSTEYIDKRLETVEENDTTEEIEVDLSESSRAQYFAKRLKIPVMVTGKGSAPFICPKTVTLKCLGDGSGKQCGFCALACNGGEATKTFSSNSPDVLKFIHCKDYSQKDAIVTSFGVPTRCPLVSVNIDEYQTMEEVRIIPKAHSVGFKPANQEYVVRMGNYLGEDLQANKKYTLAGYMCNDPNTQNTTYIFDKAYPDKDTINDFELSEEVKEYLQLFKQAEGQSVEDKFNEIHADLERNVTYVWQRRSVAFGVDLIYHTVLSFSFQHQPVKRGWGELLIIGDSGQAKTTLVERLMTHYRAGEMYSGESSKRTGLVYSMQQINGSWFLVWGAFPLNDGGLITIDEMSGISTEDLSVMSDVRSSGVAKSTGVVTAETTSRTRAIYISNPRNGRPLNTETYGVNSVLKLFGKAEDVRRLDIAMSVASGDVDASLVNKSVHSMEEIPHKYTSDACNARVLWAWSRKPDDIVFEDEAVEAILQHAINMGNFYASSIPIVEGADQRLKIARLSISAAACVMSTDEDFEKVIVKKEHVDFVAKYMTEIYAAGSFGYDKLSEQARIETDKSDENISALRAGFCTLPVVDANEMVNILYKLPYFSRGTLEDYTGLSNIDLKAVIKFVTYNQLVEKCGNEYRRTPLGTALLENLIANEISKEEISEARKNFYSGDF